MTLERSQSSAGMESLSDSPTLSDALSAAVPEVRPGLLLGSYRLLDRLGEGGMGVVYRARDERDGSLIALKTIRPKLAGNTTIRQRFLDEAKNMQRLSHPHVIRVSDIADDAETGPYYIMPLATGSLASVDKPMPEAELLKHGIAVAEALWYAHKTGALIHRDVKPENVLIDEKGQAMLCDFGIGRSLWNEILPAAANPNWRVGTPRYMAPEIASGEPGDTHADIYSLGALLYDLATGRTPYTGATADEILLQLRLGPPPKTREANPSVSIALATVIDGAMARALRDRYAEMGDVVEDLRRIQAGHAPRGPHGAAHTPQAAGVQGATVAKRPMNKGLIAVAAAAVVACAVGIPLAMNRANPPAPSLPLTEHKTEVRSASPEVVIEKKLTNNPNPPATIDPFSPITVIEKTPAKAAPVETRVQAALVPAVPPSNPVVARFTKALDSKDITALKSLLADPGFDVNKPLSNNGSLPLFLAIQRGNSKMALEMIDAGAKPDLHQNGQTTMHAAAKADLPEVISALHAKGMSVDVPNDTTKETPLYAAVFQRKASAIKTLVSLGANPDLADAAGRTPRQCATTSAPEMLSLLPASRR